MGIRNLFSLALLGFLCANLVFAGFEYNGSVNGSEGGKYNYNSLQAPYFVGVKGGELYVTDSDRNAVIVIRNDSQERVYGAAALSSPRCLAFEGQDILVCDTGNAKIKSIRGGSTTELQIVSGQSIKAPQGIFAHENRIYVSDSTNNKVFILSKNRDTYSYSGEMGGFGESDGQLKEPAGIFIEGGMLYVADSGNSRVSVFLLNGTFVRNIGTGKGGISLKNPGGVFVSDLVYVADSGNSRVEVFAKNGEPVETLEHGFSNPRGVWVEEGILYVADTWKSRIQKFKVNLSASGDNETLELLADLDTQAAKNLELQKFAREELGLSISSSASACAAEARAKYDLQEFSLAREKSRECIASAQGEENSIRTAISTEISNRLDLTSKKALEAPVEQASKASALVSQGKSLLLEKDYSGALAKQEEAEAALLGAGEQAGNETQGPSAPDATKQEAEAQYAALEGRVVSAELGSEKYAFDSGIANARLALAQIKVYIDSGQYSQAKSSMQSMEALVSSAESRLAQRKQVSYAAEAKVNETGTYIESLESYGILFKPDLSPAKGKLAQAELAISPNPAKAETLSEEAKSSAVLAREKAANLELVAGVGAVVAIAVLALLAGIAYMLYQSMKRGKRKRL